MKAVLATLIALTPSAVLARAPEPFQTGGLFGLVVWLLLAAVLFYLAKWLIAEIAPDPPFDKIIKVVVALLVFIFIMNALFSVMGKPFIPL